ncbi:replication protein [Legionella fairfieldensis]|uniref:replication protein n=1 Tax=Legionella fairfieldensis TaxID=45064 RepID=UPI001F5F78C5|nr:replication protein [Legionella fairfieldensis]
MNDESLSWGAKGLHAYLLSLPDNWKVRVSDLKERARNGRDAVRGLLGELKQAGYIQKSTCRDDVSGRFGGVEYLVLEIPTPQNQDEEPETEKPSLVKNEQITPGPENPSLVNPATEKPSPVNPTLININRINNKELNNKELNNKTAAATSDVPAKTTSTQIQPEAAAVIFPQSLHPFEKNTPSHEPIDLLSRNDALINEKLTQTQKQRINALVNSLNVPQRDVLMEEIEFCLLNPKHFTTCGNDFSRKLNAIRKVILRGDWQTPVGLMQKLTLVQHSNDCAVKQLEIELKEVHAEAIHFKKLLATAKEQMRPHFEGIISQAQSKIHTIEKQLRLLLSQKEEASCLVKELR